MNTKLVNRFKDYELRFIPAVKKNKLGRASDGEIFGIKRSLARDEAASFTSLLNYTHIKVESKLINFFIIPSHLNCNYWIFKY